MASTLRDLLSRFAVGTSEFWRGNVVRWRGWRSRSDAASERAYLEALRAPVPSRRWQAAAALGRNPLRSPEAVAALLDALADPEQFVRWQAAEALAAQEAGRVFASLKDALEDPEPLRRCGAAEALGRLGGEASALVLRQHVADSDPGVRAAVAMALGQAADPTSASAVVPLLNDADPDVRRAAARALGRIGDPATAASMAAALARPRQPLLVRRALAAALARAPHPDAQAQLLAAIADPDPQVRAYAAKALGQVGSEAAYPALSALRSDKSRLIKGTVADRAAIALSLLERRGRRATGSSNTAGSSQ